MIGHLRELDQVHQPETAVLASEEKHEQQRLWTELERVYGRITSGRERADDWHAQVSSARAPAPLPEDWNPLDRLREIFGLSSFELDILLLCMGTAIDRRFREALAACEPELRAPTLGLAIALLEGAHWSVLSRMRPLRYWRLIEIGPELLRGQLLEAPLEIDERILQFLLGVPASDERLEAIVHPLVAEEDQTDDASAELTEAAARGAVHWRRSPQATILLTGSRASQRTALFEAICRIAGLHMWTLDAADLPDAPAERERLARAYTREAALWPAALLIKTERVDNCALLEAWLKRVSAPVAVDVQEGSAAERLSGLRLAAPSLSAGERKQQWQRRLGPLSVQLAGQLDTIVDTFALDAREIRETAEAIEEEASLAPDGDTGNATLAAAAWQLCRTAARRSLDELATHIESSATWPDLVLPDAQNATLRQIAVHARQAAVVHGEWGFADRYGRGLGLSALFAGPSGTGKTMAAGVLARELKRDLYQIDLATVVSKYIGETEKHLRRIFDAAERSGAILLFDEADALFGKRSHVRDSHDRYANLEICYLLQRMESYRGIAILTTNMQNALDPAFQRRLRFVVQFPFPDPASRERIWRKVFPGAAPTADLDFTRLSQLNVTGGSIRNIALLAAFLAADVGSSIQMKHILEAARSEYAKLDKPLSAAETRGWQ